MVGKRLRGSPDSMTAQRDILSGDLAERDRALPELRPRCATPPSAPAPTLYLVGGAVRDALLGPGADEPRPGGRRGPRARWSRRSGARRGPRPLRDRDRAPGRQGRSTSRGRARRPTRSPVRCPRCARRRSPRTSRGATSRSTRWRSRFDAPSELIDPHGGLDDLRGRAAAGAARRLVRRRPDPGAARGPLRGPVRASSSSPRPLALLRATDLGTVSRDRVAAELRQARRGAERPRAASSCSPAGGCSSSRRAPAS